jgi:hypothetical protein
MKFNVTIKATVTKTYTVEADTEEDAVTQAQGEFSVLNDDINEQYEQDIVSVKEAS